MSDYIERLRGELLRAGATQPRRVRVPSYKPALVLVAAAAIVALVVIALPQRSDEREATGATATYRVSGDVETTATMLRERMAALGVAGTVDVSGDTVTIPDGARGLTAPGILAVYDRELGLAGPNRLDNTAIASARTGEDPMTGEPVVVIQLTPEGEREFEALTRAVAERGADLRELQHLAITVDGRLYSEPYIDWRQAPEGIDGSEGMHIADGFTRAQAKELAAVLDSGPLPGKLTAN